MTDKTNQCKSHSGLETCANAVKKEIKDQVWPAVRGMVPWRTFIVIGSVVVAFGLILIRGNSTAIEKNTVKIECLQQIAKDVQEIKAVVVKE